MTVNSKKLTILLCFCMLIFTRSLFGQNNLWEQNKEEVVLDTSCKSKSIFGTCIKLVENENSWITYKIDSEKSGTLISLLWKVEKFNEYTNQFEPVTNPRGTNFPVLSKQTIYGGGAGIYKIFMGGRRIYTMGASGASASILYSYNFTFTKEISQSEIYKYNQCGPSSDPIIEIIDYERPTVKFTLIDDQYGLTTYAGYRVDNDNEIEISGRKEITFTVKSRTNHRCQESRPKIVKISEGKSHIKTYKAKKDFSLAYYDQNRNYSSNKTRNDSRYFYTNINYYDEEGRVVQTVAKAQSPSGKDIISPSYIHYNQEYDYTIPSFISEKNDGSYVEDAVLNSGINDRPDTNKSKAFQFYKNPIEGHELGFSSLLSTTQLLRDDERRTSPLHIKDGVSKEKSYGYFESFSEYNTAVDNILKFEHRGKPSDQNWTAWGNLYNDKNYAADKLIKSYTLNSNSDLVTYTFTNTWGLEILNRTKNKVTGEILDQYTIYDYKDRPIMTLTPKAVKEVQRTKELREEIIANLCTRYVYDVENRIIATKHPSQKYWSQTIYDALERPVLTQMPDQAINDLWTLNLYDEDGDVFATKEIKAAGTSNDSFNLNISKRLDLQKEADQYVPIFKFFDQEESEKWVVGQYGISPLTNRTPYNQKDPNGFYSNLNLKDDASIKMLSYVDEYDIKDIPPYPDPQQFENIHIPKTPSDKSFDAVTYTEEKVYDNEGAKTKLRRAFYYNDDGQLILTVTKSKHGQIFSGIIYDSFDRVTTNELVIYRFDDVTTRITDRFEYDVQNRVIKQFKRINNDQEVQLVQNHYNELGELVREDLHVKGSKVLQSINYSFDKQGRLYKINDAIPKDGDYFGQELYFDSGFRKTRKDGLPTGIKWASSIDENRKTYAFDYDGLNRMHKAQYVEGQSNAWKKTSRHNVLIGTVEKSGYDANGNIQQIQRWGDIDGTLAKIDDLEFTYKDHTGVKGNELIKVKDLSKGYDANLGYVDRSEADQTMFYDDAGRLIKDLSHNIESITYYPNSRPKRIVVLKDSNEGTYSTEVTIDFEYLESGEKYTEKMTLVNTHKATDVKDEPITSTTYFFSEGEYLQLGEEKPTVKFYNHAYGRAVPTNETDGLNYEYYLKDHLGNIRVVFGEKDQVREFIATMEEGTVNDKTRLKEDAFFRNIENTETSLYPELNHTPDGLIEKSKIVAELDGSKNPIGPMLVLEVFKGDEVSSEVFSKHVKLKETKAHIDFGSTFNGQISNPDIHSAYSMEQFKRNKRLLNNMFDASVNQTSNTLPRAHLNMVFYDEAGEVYDMQTVPISERGGFDITEPRSMWGGHERLRIPATTVTKSGHVMVFVSNLSKDSKVFFDDLKVVHNGGKIISKKDYYPFGEVFAAVEKAKMMTVGQKVLGYYAVNRDSYQGKQYEKLLGWHDFHARRYDASLGRFVSVDQRYQFGSGYLGMGNIPMMGVDPDGESVLLAIAIGGIIGGLNAAINGGDVTDILNGVGKGILFSAAGAAGPAVSIGFGAVNSLMTGGNPVLGALTAGFGHMTGGEVESLKIGAGVESSFGKVLVSAGKGAIVGGLNSGVSSTLNGGNFIANFSSGASIGAFSNALYSTAKIASAKIKITNNEKSYGKIDNNAIILPGVLIEDLRVRNYPLWWGDTQAFMNPTIYDRRYNNSDPHIVLDGVGLLPGIGIFADVINSGLYFTEGDLVNGLVSMGAALPVVGNAVTGSKVVVKGTKAASGSTQGGLNLFKWGAPQTGKNVGWKAGDYVLHLPNKGTPKLNWKANYGALRREMGLGKPIFDSYRTTGGNLIPTKGFLKAERSILQGRGWIYNPSKGAWMP